MLNNVIEYIKNFFSISTLNDIKFSLELNKLDIIYNSEIFLYKQCFYFSFSIFFLGVIGIVFNRKNIINVMISIELLLLGACLNIIFLSIFLDSIVGQMFALFIIAIAAADSAVGLGILVAAFYLKRSISFESFSFLKN